MKFTFAEPYTFEEKEYEEIEMDLDGLKGSDMAAVKREWTKAGNFSPMPGTDMDFCAGVAAKASKLPIEFFEGMPARDFMNLSAMVTNFLHG